MLETCDRSSVLALTNDSGADDGVDKVEAGHRYIRLLLVTESFILKQVS
jgi:hypothetical protein